MGATLVQDRRMYRPNMSESNDSHNRHRQEREAFLRKLQDQASKRLTPDDIAEARDIMRGAVTRGSAQKTTFMEDFRRWLHYLSLTGALRKATIGAGLVVACVIGLLMIPSSQLSIQTPSAWSGPTQDRLPGTLHFQFGETKASLEEGGLLLAGTLGKPTRSANILTTFDFFIKGSLSNGLPFLFEGHLLVTNAPGVEVVQGKGDFVGAALVGELTRGTNAPVPINQPYLP